jgi:hypothetical protein
MQTIIGKEIEMAVSIEAVRGTAEATAHRNIRKVECNIIPQTETVLDDTTSRGLEDAEGVTVVKKFSEGDISSIVHADTFGYFLLNLYGSVESDEVGDEVYKNTYTLLQNIEHPTLTLFVKDGSVRQSKIASGVVSNFELTATNDDYVRYSASFIGKEGVADTSTLPEPAKEYDFVGRDVTIKVADTAEGLSSAEALDVENITITWNPNIQTAYFLGSYSPAKINNGAFSIEGSFTKHFVDETFKNMKEGNTAKFMSINIKSSVAIDTGIYPEITIILDRMMVTDWNRSSGANEYVREDVTFKAFKNSTTGKASQVELTSKSSYQGS